MVRTAVSFGPIAGTDQFGVFFGDQRANAYAVNALTGALLWKTRVEDHPAALITGAPTLYSGILYVPVSSFEEVTGGRATYECFTFRGSVVALDSATGKPIWKGYTIPEAPRPTKQNATGTQLHGPSGAAVWSAPTIDVQRQVLYVATGDNYSDPPSETSDAILAFELATGKMLWHRQATANDSFIVSCFSADRINCPESNGPDHDFWTIADPGEYAPAADSVCWSSGRNPASSTHWIPIRRARSSGRRGSARVVRWEGSCGAPPQIRTTFMSRTPTSGLAPVTET